MAREDRALRESSETEKKTERVRDIHGLSLSLSLLLEIFVLLLFHRRILFYFCFIDLCGEEDLDGAEAWKS
jgi:hypothetical protein